MARTSPPFVGFARFSVLFALAVPIVFVADLSTAGTLSGPVAIAPAWLGIHMESPGPGATGVSVVHVVRGSPAAKAGILDGDRVVKIDGASVGAPMDISRAVAQAGPGKTLRVSVLRAGGSGAAAARASASFVIDVLLEARPSADVLFHDANVGQTLPTLPALSIASGSGPAQYPALAGHVVLIDLFATWCGPCAQLGPHYAVFHGKYASKGLVVLGISREDTSMLAGWSTQNAVPYTIASDPSDTVFEQLEAPALPSSLLIDKHGTVREVWVGYDPKQVVDVERKIQALIAEP